ncbi:MAG: nucleotidyltransferase domain-containing protein [Armatimonadetes bacterium]|nr:nucleotidyltransferase domain-containing protein [Armatimonadota bacterium]
MSTGAASIRLRELAALGLVTPPEAYGAGYTVNRYHPLLRQWKVFLNTWDLMPVVRRVAAKARRIVLFGSAAWGADDEESDLDVFVETTVPQTIGSLFPEQIRGRPLQVLICTPEQAADIRKNNRPLWANISRGVVLWDEVEPW